MLVGAEDRVESGTPVLGEHQRVVLEFGQVTLHAEVQKQCAGAGRRPVPVLLAVGLLLRREQVGLAEVQVGGRDDQVGANDVAALTRVGVFHADRRATLYDDPGGGRRAGDRDALGLGERRDRFDHAGESAERVEHTLREIEVAHQVVHAGRLIRRAP